MYFEKKNQTNWWPHYKHLWGVLAFILYWYTWTNMNQMIDKEFLELSGKWVGHTQKQNKALKI